MKKLILLSLIVFICIISLIACNTENSTDKLNINDEESPEKKTLEIVKQMVDEPVGDTFDLYFVTSSLPTVETFEEFEKGEQEINKVLLKLNDKEGKHAFSQEAKQLVEQMTLSAEKVIKYKKLLLEYSELGNTKKTDEIQQAYFDEITNIADKMKEYEKLYHVHKNNE